MRIREMLIDFTRLFKYMGEHMRDIWLGIITGSLSQLSAIGCAVSGAYLVTLAAGGNRNGFTVIFAVTLSLALLHTIMRYGEMFYAHKAAYGILASMRITLYKAVEKIAPAFLLKRRTGDMVSMLMSDVETLEWFYAHTYGSCIIAMIIPSVVLASMCVIHWMLPIALVPWLALTVSVPFWLKRKSDLDGEKIRRALADVNAEVVDGIQGLREILTFGYNSLYIKKLRKCNKALSKIQGVHGRRSGFENGMMILFMSLALITTLAIAMGLIGKGLMPKNLYPVAVIMTAYIFAPVLDISRMARNFGVIQASAKRLFTVLETPPNVEDTVTGIPVGLKDNTVRFDNVSFRYGRDLPYVLNGLSFTVVPGETVALVGHSGAGKSTCANLLLRFWDVEDGAVRIGETDVREMPQSFLRGQIAVVPQDIYLFNTPVIENIRLGKPDATIEEVITAAKLALAHDFISALPQGYDTYLGERGLQLSGGQRQRIAIARAFLRNAPILLMDEALSNLDAENERDLQILMNTLRSGRTTLIIAHRLSTIMSADRVVMLEGGVAAETGTHEELLRRDGAYRRLIGVQYGGTAV